MKRVRYIIVHTMLVLGLCAMPMQNVWSMAAMPLCDMEMSSHDMGNMDMSEEPSGVDMASCCDDSQCNKCSHGATFVLMADTVINDNDESVAFTVVKSIYLSVFIPIDSPPPIFS